MTSGIILINKTRGITSHDVVDKVRFLIKGTKVGHAGTLDPEAQGLLIILLGKECKSFQKFLKLPKEYEFEMLFGFSTPTLDLEGTSREFAIKHASTINFSEKKLKQVIKQFVGEYEQEIPIFSAKKVHGVPLYKLARACKKDVKVHTKTVTINSLSLISFKPPVANVHLSCSSGTYVRALVADLAKKLKTKAVASSIKRTSIGPYNLKDALDIETFNKIKNIKDEVIPI